MTVVHGMLGTQAQMLWPDASPADLAYLSGLLKLKAHGATDAEVVARFSEHMAQQRNSRARPYDISFRQPPLQPDTRVAQAKVDRRLSAIAEYGFGGR